MGKDIVILRYGHRIVRDQRVTTHCCLAAGAFGASEVIICGSEDKELEKTIGRVNSKWDEKLKISYTDSWIKTAEALRKNGYFLVHLTMYGDNYSRAVKREISKAGKICVIIGSQKVEPAVYEIADRNIAIEKRPHSEISALAIFLYETGNFLK